MFLWCVRLLDKCILESENLQSTNSPCLPQNIHNILSVPLLNMLETSKGCLSPYSRRYWLLGNIRYKSNPLWLWNRNSSSYSRSWRTSQTSKQNLFQRRKVQRSHPRHLERGGVPKKVGLTAVYIIISIDLCTDLFLLF